MIVRITAAASGLALSGVGIADDDLSLDMSVTNMSDEIYIEADEPFRNDGLSCLHEDSTELDKHSDKH